MRLRFQPWQLAIALVLLCLALWGLVRWRARRPYDAQRLVSVLPARNATLIYLDIAALRDGGILDLIAGSKSAEEADYRRFVDQTGFDYRTDLDGVAVSLVGLDSYFALRGRFQWKQLASYATSQGGECHYTVCSMPASAAERNISFYPLSQNVLALAVAPDPRAVNDINSGTGKDLQTPVSPLWIMFPGSVFSSPDALPPLIKEFAAPLAQARRAILTAGPRGNALQVTLEVACNSPQQAGQLVQQLSQLTNLFKAAGGTDDDLRHVISSGTFQQQGAQVLGRWPVERAFLDQLFRPQTP